MLNKVKILKPKRAPKGAKSCRREWIVIGPNGIYIVTGMAYMNEFSLVPGVAVKFGYRRVDGAAYLVTDNLKDALAEAERRAA